MSDLINRQDAIDAVLSLPDCQNGFSDTYDKARIIGVIEDLPSADPHLINIEAYAHDMEISLAQAEKELQVYPWIPCSERLPEKEQAYLVTQYDVLKRLKTNRIMYMDGEWKTAWKPIAWMPMPEPYKEKQND